MSQINLNFYGIRVKIKASKEEIDNIKHDYCYFVESSNPSKSKTIDITNAAAVTTVANTLECSTRTENGISGALILTETGSIRIEIATMWRPYARVFFGIYPVSGNC